MYRIKEILEADENRCYEIANILNIDKTIIYDWRNGNSMPNFDNLIKFADYFGYSIDYILSRTNDDAEYHTINLMPFGEHLKDILKIKNITKYKLFKDCKLSNSYKVRWFNQNVKPSVANLIKMADYLNVSMDELMGRMI